MVKPLFGEIRNRLGEARAASPFSQIATCNHRHNLHFSRNRYIPTVGVFRRTFLSIRLSCRMGNWRSMTQVARQSRNPAEFTGQKYDAKPAHN